MNDNIILIGMPSVGKSSAGIVLAKKLGYSFVDSDLVIQKKEGRLLHQIIEEDGLDGFIEIENRINSQLQAEKSVIATGGSAVYGSDAMEHFSKIGKIIYLRASYDTISSKLLNIKERGVAIRENQTLHDLYVERTALYERYSDLKIDLDNLTIEDTVYKIVKMLQ